MRKLLIVSGPLDYGGAGKIIKFVVNYLVKRGWKITIFSLRQNEKSRDLDSNIVFYGKDGAIDKKLKFLPWRIDEILQIRQIVKKEHPDVVCAFVSDHVFMSRIATIGLKGFKFVGAERGDPYTLPSKWVKPVKWAYKKCDNCIFQLKKQGEFFGSELMKKSSIIPNPYIPLCKIPVYDGERRKTIISAGRFEYQKGFDVLIRAFAKVHDKHKDYKLILLGSGLLLKDYVELSKELGVEQFIEYPGYVKNVAEAVSREGIFVLPSRFEGIPNALIEALSTGIPTVSANCTPGGPEFLTNNGERGILVDVDDIDATADAINYLIEHPRIAKDYGMKGTLVIQELEPSQIASQWEYTFNKILSEK